MTTPKKTKAKKIVDKVEDAVVDVVEEVKEEANETVGTITIKRWQAALIAAAIALGLIAIIL